MHENNDRSDAALSMYKLQREFFELTLRASGRERDQIGNYLDELFFSLLQSCDVTKAVEIGAYEGSFSKRFKGQYPDCPSIAYEANPYVYERFKAGLEKAGIDYRFSCVSDTAGKMTFMVPIDFRGSERNRDNQIGSLMSNNFSEKSESFEVDSVRLDDDIDLQPDDRLALWVDVEGACETVLGNVTDALDRTVAIMIEVESAPLWEGQWLDTDVFTFLSSKGFVPIARDIQRKRQFNYIYLNKNLYDPHNFMKAHYRYLVGKNEYA